MGGLLRQIVNGLWLDVSPPVGYDLPSFGERCVGYWQSVVLRRGEFSAHQSGIGLVRNMSQPQLIRAHIEQFAV